MVKQGGHAPVDRAVQAPSSKPTRFLHCVRFLDDMLKTTPQYSTLSVILDKGTGGGDTGSDGQWRLAGMIGSHMYLRSTEDYEHPQLTIGPVLVLPAFQVGPSHPATCNHLDETRLLGLRAPTSVS